MSHTELIELSKQKGVRKRIPKNKTKEYYENMKKEIEALPDPLSHECKTKKDFQRKANVISIMFELPFIKGKKEDLQNFVHRVTHKMDKQPKSKRDLIKEIKTRIPTMTKLGRKNKRELQKILQSLQV